jgi:predicted small lipoprotein YifL
MKAMIPVLLMLLLSGCMGRGGPQDVPPPPVHNDPQTCNNTSASANSDCSQSVVPAMH